MSLCLLFRDSKYYIGLLHPLSDKQGTATCLLGFQTYYYTINISVFKEPT